MVTAGFQQDFPVVEDGPGWWACSTHNDPDRRAGGGTVPRARVRDAMQRDFVHGRPAGYAAKPPSVGSRTATCHTLPGGARRPASGDP